MNWRLQTMALIPKNALSLCVGWAVNRKWPFSLHRRLRDMLIRIYRIKVAEAEKPLEAYPTFGEFFIRKLKPGSRPLDQGELVSPVDALATQRGIINSERMILQAKGIPYRLDDFIADSERAKPFVGGFYLTLYLAPYNYHRIHAPCEMDLTCMRHIPGALWPVNAWSVAGLPELFVRNERVLAFGKHPQGEVVVAMVGATNVGRISIDGMPGFHSNDTHKRSTHDLPLHAPRHYAKGEGLGCFEMGSTVILLLSAGWTSNLAPWLFETESRTIQMGEALLRS